MGIFKEYLNSKGKVEKGEVDVSGDRTDPMTPPTKPPKEHPSKKPYVSDGKKIKGDKGFGDMGEKDTKYDPCCDSGSKGKDPAKIPTAEQTFAELELVPLVTESVIGNPTLLEKVVYDLKRNGQMSALVAEMMTHRETYSHIVQLMKDETYGPDICKKMTRAMKQVAEEVDTPFHKAAESGDDEAADLDDAESQDIQDEDGLDDNMIDNEPEMNGDESGEEQTDPMGGMEPPDPLMGADDMSPEMSQFQRSFQRSFQKNFHRKMMSGE